MPRVFRGDQQLMAQPSVTEKLQQMETSIGKLTEQFQQQKEDNSKLQQLLMVNNRQMDKLRTQVAQKTAEAKPASGKKRLTRKESATELKKEVKKLKTGEHLFSLDQEPSEACASLIQNKQGEVAKAIAQGTYDSMLEDGRFRGEEDAMQHLLQGYLMDKGHGAASAHSNRSPLPPSPPLSCTHGCICDACQPRATPSTSTTASSTSTSSWTMRESAKSSASR